MANWKFTLRIGDIWNNEDMPIEEKGKQIALRIKRMVPSSYLNWEHDNYDSEIEEIAERFENITGYDDVLPIEEFDDVMEQLYNWSDQEVAPFDKWPRNAMCWIETSFSRVQTAK